jgi:hypothetical protein
MIAGRNAWSDLIASDFLSLGAILFYILIGLLIAAVMMATRGAKAALSLPGGMPDIAGAPPPELDLITSKLNAALKKNEDFERSVEAIGKNMEELSKRHHALFIEKKHRDAVREKVWCLKRHAREIRRRWPNSEFAWYPAAKGLWAVAPAGVPASLTNVSHNREWVVDALKWHETFVEFIAKLGRDEAYLNSLDFDELMESLDAEERAACGISDSHDPNQPIVIAEYDIRTTDHTRHGFNVSNVNLRTAYDVKIVPLRFGKWRAFFPDRLATLDRTAGKEFLELSAQYPGGGVLGQDLYSLMNDWRVEADCWGFPVPLRVVYRDSASNWYMSTFLLEQNDAGRGAQTIICRARPHKMDERLSYIRA